MAQDEANLEAGGFWPGALKPILRLFILPVKYIYFRLKQAAAYVVRRTLPAIEKIAPSLGRRVRKSNWIWQPVFGHQHLNKFYEDKEDPFNFASPYEAEKYAHSLRLLEGRTYESALEVGAAEGIFTELLAPYCTSVLGVELADVAVERAKARLAHLDNVSVIQATLPQEMPAEKFDLIVASDVLYYFAKDVLKDVLSGLEDALEEGGILFSLHYLGNFGQPILGESVHDVMKHRTACELVHAERVKNVGPHGAGYDVLILKKKSGTH